MVRKSAIGIVIGMALGVSACSGAGGAGGSTTAGPADGAAAVVAASPAVADKVPGGVKSKGELSFGMDATYAPFEYFDTDNKTIIGFDADLSDAMAAKMGLKAKHVNASFDTILLGVSSGKFDVGMSDFSATPERAKVVDFVVYGAAGTGLGVKPGNPKHLSVDASTLCGHSVATVKGSTQGDQILPDFSQKCEQSGKPAISIQLFPSQNDANLALSSGRTDAVMGDDSVVSYQAKLSKGAFELASGPSYDPAMIGLALPKNSPLAPAFAEAIKELKQDGTIAKLAEKWSIPGEFVTQATMAEVMK